MSTDRPVRLRKRTTTPLTDGQFRGAVEDLRTVFGARQIASICNVAPSTVNSWVQGLYASKEPATWLRLAYLHDAVTELSKQSHFTVAGWFTRQVPATGRTKYQGTAWKLLCSDRIEETGPVVLAAAEAAGRDGQ